MAISTVGNLLDYVRLQLNSEKVGGADTYSLWSDSELINYIDQAQQEFSRQTLSLPDYSNFTVNVVSGTNEYTYDSQIIDIFGGWLTTLERAVYARNFDDVNKGWILNADRLVVGGDWIDDTGPPKFIIPDMHLDKLILWPNPVSNDTLTLYVYKEADHVDATDDALEIDSQYRLGLTYRVMALAYGKHDVMETEDMERSTIYSQKWKSFWQDAKKAYDLRFKRIG